MRKHRIYLSLSECSQQAGAPILFFPISITPATFIPHHPPPPPRPPPPVPIRARLGFRLFTPLLPPHSHHKGPPWKTFVRGPNTAPFSQYSTVDSSSKRKKHIKSFSYPQVGSGKLTVEKILGGERRGWKVICFGFHLCNLLLRSAQKKKSRPTPVYFAADR